MIDVQVEIKEWVKGLDGFTAVQYERTWRFLLEELGSKPLTMDFLIKHRDYIYAKYKPGTIRAKITAIRAGLSAIGLNELVEFAPLPRLNNGEVTVSSLNIGDLFYLGKVRHKVKEKESHYVVCLQYAGRSAYVNETVRVPNEAVVTSLIKNKHYKYVDIETNPNGEEIHVVRDNHGVDKWIFLTAQHASDAALKHDGYTVIVQKIKGAKGYEVKHE